MYQNVYYNSRTNTIHCWDDKEGYHKRKIRHYAYQRSESGIYESIYGDKLKKVHMSRSEMFEASKSNPNLFESDVAVETRYLIDNYGNSDDVSTGHKVLTFDIEVEMISGLPDTTLAENEITSVAFHDSITDEKYVYVVSKEVEINKKFKGAFVRSFKQERDMLLAFVDKWAEINPTLITGWNIDFFDVKYLVNRLKNLFGDSVAAKLSSIGEFYNDRYRDRYIIAGVASLDYMALYKNFTYTELPNYRLDTVSRKELGRGKIEYQGNLDQLLRDDIEKFIEYNLVDVELVVDLDRKLKLIDLARAVCHAGHVSYENFMLSSRWLEGAILTYLRRNDKVAPNRPRTYSTEGDNEASFAGAFVKEPKAGRYSWIYDLDLTSLYPSIIMSLNISPETKIGRVTNYDLESRIRGNIDNFIIEELNGEHVEMTADDFEAFLKESKFGIASNGVLYRQDQVGVIPKILSEWFDKRVEFKNTRDTFKKGTDDYNFYDQRQLVQKIMLNSAYGVLGLASFRFFDLDNAVAVTSTGQAVIQTTEKIANGYYNKKIGDIYELELEDGRRLELGANAVVTLKNGLSKKISELVDGDDILI